MLACAEPFVWTPERQTRELRLDVIAALRRGDAPDLLNKDSDFGANPHAYFGAHLMPLFASHDDARELEVAFGWAVERYFAERGYPSYLVTSE